MKKKIMIITVILLIIAGAFWARGYYNDRYVISDYYYTQIPADEVNEDSWLVDADGVKQEKGKEYHLIGYNTQGASKEIYFTQSGGAADYYAPGTYIKVSTSKTLTIGIEIINETEVTQKALHMIQKHGTKMTAGQVN